MHRLSNGTAPPPVLWVSADGSSHYLFPQTRDWGLAVFPYAPHPGGAPSRSSISCTSAVSASSSSRSQRRSSLAFASIYRHGCRSGLPAFVLTCPDLSGHRSQRQEESKNNIAFLHRWKACGPSTALPYGENLRAPSRLAPSARSPASALAWPVQICSRTVFCTRVCTLLLTPIFLLCSCSLPVPRTPT